MKKLMLGNEAIARGAYEAGVKVSAAYPGTPSTEISETIAKYDEVYAEWAPNEKVAAEVAIGASISGVRSMCCMKHVGLNVAADPLFTCSYTGVGGGLVAVVADDPGLYSSQNEQDTRLIGRAAMIPVIEPSDSQEAKDYMKRAFELSESGTPKHPQGYNLVSGKKGIRVTARAAAGLFYGAQTLRNMIRNAQKPELDQVTVSETISTVFSISNATPEMVVSSRARPSLPFLIS